MNIESRIAALRGTATIAPDAALELATDNYNEARERARYAKDDLRAAEAADRDAGLLQTSKATDAATLKADRTAADAHAAYLQLEAERKRFGKVFLSAMDPAAREIGDIMRELADAIEALSNSAYGIAAFASRHGLPVHRSVDHAASLDSVVRKLRFTI